MFVELFDAMSANANTLQSGMTNIVNVISPLLITCFVGYVLMIAVSYWQGVGFEGVLVDVLKRIFFLAFVLGLGLNVGTYTGTVFPLVTDLGTDLSQAWNGNSGSSQNAGQSLDGLVDKVIQITDTNMEQAWSGLPEQPTTPNPPLPSNPTPSPTPSGNVESVNNTGDGLGSIGEGITSALFGDTLNTMVSVVVAFTQNVLIWIGALIFLVVAAAFLMLTQYTLLLLAAVGPIFFGFAVFPATRQFFGAWVGQILNFAFLNLFINVLVTMFISTVDGTLDDIVTTAVNSGLGSTLLVSASMPFKIAGEFILFGVILLQLPTMASSLFGGLTGGGFNSAIAATAPYRKGAAAAKKMYSKKRGGNKISSS
ncbi:type IV secretion system protein (plasmid) [Moraxella atlantae]|uniref:type IV secretion system protein n=1 Tax=Faucicola atlantae TaxID=34059 RepID=UPI00375066A6